NEIIIWLRDETRQKSMATGDPYVYPLLPGKDAAFEVRSHMIARVRGQDWSFRRFKGQWYYRVTDSKKPYAAMGANFTIGNGESAGPVAVLHFETPYRIHVANEVKDTTLEIRIPAPIPEPSSESTIRANVQTLARWIGTRPQLGESDNYVWVRAVVDPEGRIAHLSALPHDEDVPPARHLDAPLDDGYRIIYCLWSPTGRWTWMAREIRWVIREGGQWREEPVTAHGYPMNFIEAGNRLSQGLKGRNEDQRLLWIANVLPGILAALTVAVIQWWQHPMAWPHAIVWGLSSVVIAMVLHEGWHFIFALNDWLGPRLIGGKSGPAWTGSWPRIRVTQQGIAVRSMTNDAGWRTAERLAGLPFILVIATRPVLRLFGIEFNVLLSDPAVWVPALAINILSLAPLQHIASRLREIHPRWVPTVVHATDGDELLDDFISRNSSGPKGPERSAGVRTQRIFRAAAGRMFRQRLPPQPRCILQAA
ncbi:MAG TPA: hypothetical protein VMU17_06685, partial [Elusimicrobiota bacterium]|nr:hypothetical protein [Elusimicrobiota bacterium]